MKRYIMAQSNKALLCLLLLFSQYNGVLASSTLPDSLVDEGVRQFEFIQEFNSRLTIEEAPMKKYVFSFIEEDFAYIETINSEGEAGTDYVSEWATQMQAINTKLIAFNDGGPSVNPDGYKIYACLASRYPYYVQSTIPSDANTTQKIKKHFEDLGNSYASSVASIEASQKITRKVSQDLIQAVKTRTDGKKLVMLLAIHSPAYTLGDPDVKEDVDVSNYTNSFIDSELSNQTIAWDIRLSNRFRPSYYTTDHAKAFQNYLKSNDINMPMSPTSSSGMTSSLDYVTTFFGDLENLAEEPAEPCGKYYYEVAKEFADKDWIKDPMHPSYASVKADPCKAYGRWISVKPDDADGQQIGDHWYYYDEYYIRHFANRRAEKEPKLIESLSNQLKAMIASSDRQIPVSKDKKIGKEMLNDVLFAYKKATDKELFVLHADIDYWLPQTEFSTVINQIISKVSTYDETKMELLCMFTFEDRHYRVVSVVNSGLILVFVTVF